MRQAAGERHNESYKQIGIKERKTVAREGGESKAGLSAVLSWGIDPPSFFLHATAGPRGIQRRCPAHGPARRHVPGTKPQLQGVTRQSRSTAVLPRSEEHTSELQSLRHLVCR